MIAFGCSITIPDTFERCAKPGIDRVREPGSPVLAHAAAGSLARSYNLMLDEVAGSNDLEALVLVHQDAEIVDPELCAKLRRVLRDPDVAVVGCVGAAGVRGLAWWDGAVTWGSAVVRYGELGGGDAALDGGPSPPREVDALYGFLLALSPWAVRTLCFDEALGPIHGYDADLCLQARAAGRKVVAEDLRVVHHHALQLVTEPEPWAETYVRVAEKWDPGNDDWKARARRAEAEAAAARLLAASRLLQAYARAQEHDDRMREVTGTVGWRVTEPLRRLNARRRRGAAS